MKRKQLGLTLTKMYWLLNRYSKLIINNKLLVYKTIIKPIWCYGIQLWGTASNSNVEILSSQKCTITYGMCPTRSFGMIYKFQQSRRRWSIKQYRNRLSMHPNNLATNFMNPSINNKRLLRYAPNDFPSRF